MSIEDVQADIATTRAELAETADALAAKVAAKARVGKKIALGVAGAALAIAIVQRIRR